MRICVTTGQASFGDLKTPFTQRLTPDEAASSFSAINDLLSLLTMIPVDSDVLGHAAVIVRTADLRSLDAIQLATALSRK